MEKFLEQINEEAEELAKKYQSEKDVAIRETLLISLGMRLSILADAQSLKTSSITADFTKQMQEQSKNIDFSKIDFNNLMNQLKDLR